MKANELLFWLSARREGSWQQFRAAVEELHSVENVTDVNGMSPASGDRFRLHQQLRFDFESLGHAEFFARECEEGWRVAPPTLAAHSATAGFRAVLCGARSPALRERLVRAAQEMGCQTLDPHGVPEVIRVIAATNSALADLATQVGICFQPNAPLAILSHLPRCDPPSRSRQQSEFPEGGGWRVREFDVSTLAWGVTDRQRAQAARFGLFEFQLYDRWRFFLRWRGGTFEMPRAVGIYALLDRYRGLLRYDAQAHTLSLPGSCRPPRLLERALVLCSGFPPSFDRVTSNLTYADVPLDIAHFAAELLGQTCV